MWSSTARAQHSGADLRYGAELSGANPGWATAVDETRGQ